MSCALSFFLPVDFSISPYIFSFNSALSIVAPLSFSNLYEGSPQTPFALPSFYHLNAADVLKVSLAMVKSSMCWKVKGKPVISKNFSQPILSIHSPTLSCFFAPAMYISSIFLTAVVTSGHLGGLFGIYGTTSFENLGLLLKLPTLPPATMATPSFSASEMGRAGQTE